MATEGIEDRTIVNFVDESIVGEDEGAKLENGKVDGFVELTMLGHVDGWIVGNAMGNDDKRFDGLADVATDGIVDGTTDDFADGSTVGKDDGSVEL